MLFCSFLFLSSKYMIDCSYLSTWTLIALQKLQLSKMYLKQKLFFLTILPNILNFNDQKSAACIDRYAFLREAVFCTKLFIPQRGSILHQWKWVFFFLHRIGIKWLLTWLIPKTSFTVHCSDVTLEITAVYSCLI